MPDITISSGTLEDYNGSENVLELRIFPSNTMAVTDNETVLEGNNEHGFYIKVDCTVGTNCDDDATTCISYETFVLESTEDASPNDTTYLVALYTTAGERLRTIHERLVVPIAPTTTTLSDLIAYSNGTTCPLPARYATFAWVLAQLAALVNMATKATVDIFGAVRLNWAAATGSDPVVVSDNHPAWRGVQASYYFEQFVGGISEMLTELGAEDCEVKVTCPYTYAGATVAIPDNIHMTFEAGGFWTVSEAATTVTINAKGYFPEDRQIFGGPGKVVLGLQVCHSMFATWWTGPESQGEADDHHAFTQVFDSARGAFGGRIVIPLGDFYDHTNICPQHCTISGAGQGLDMSAPWSAHREGTTIKLSSEAAGDIKYIWSIVDAPTDQIFRGLKIENIGFDIGSTSNARCIYGRGEYLVNNSGYGVLLERVTMQMYHTVEDLGAVPPVAEAIGTNQYGMEIDSFPTEGWEAIGVNLRQCNFIVSADNWGFRSKTANAHLSFEDCVFICQPGGESNAHGLPGGNGMRLDTHIPWTTLRNCDFRGSPGLIGSGYGYEEEFVRTLTDVTATVFSGHPEVEDHSLLTINNGDSFVLNDLGRKVDFDANFTAYIVQLLSAKTAVLSFRPTDSNYAAYDSVACDLIEWTEQPNIAGTAILVSGYGNSVHLINCVDEGFDVSIKFGGAGIYMTRMISDSSTWQGRVIFTSNGTFISRNSKYNSCSWIDEAGSMLCISDNDYIRAEMLVPGTIIFNAEVWKERGIDTRHVRDNSIKAQRLFLDEVQLAELADYTQEYHCPVIISNTQRTDSVIEPGFPDKLVPLTVGHARPFEADIPMQRWAIYDSLITNKPWIWLDLQRDENDGAWVFKPSQEGFERIRILGTLDVVGAIVVSDDVVHTGDKISSTGLIGSPTAGSESGIGYLPGAGGTVSQTTSRSTPVTINKPTGVIQVHASALAAGAQITFRVNNNCMRLEDIPVLCLHTNTTGRVTLFVSEKNDGWFDVTLRNHHASTIDDNAFSFSFIILKGTVT